jgi:hypothetical protein
MQLVAEHAGLVLLLRPYFHALTQPVMQACALLLHILWCQCTLPLGKHVLQPLQEDQPLSGGQLYSELQEAASFQEHAKNKFWV